MAAMHQLQFLVLLVCILSTVFVAGTPPQVDGFNIRAPVPRIESLTQTYTMFLDCSGSGNPPPTFQFGKVMPAVGLQDPVTKMIDANYPDKRFTIKDSTLIINNLNASDGGIYVCFAKNQFGEVLKELIVKIRVLGQFDFASRAERDTRGHSVTMYKETKIECPPRSYTFPSIIEWGSVPPVANPNARTKRIPISNRVFYGNDGALHFANVLPQDIRLINDDYRGIQCLMSVGLGTRASNKFTLRVDRQFDANYKRNPNFASFMAKNTIIVKDQESIFTCGGYGRPTPTVEWYKDGVRIRDLGGGSTNYVGYTLGNFGVELRIVRPRKEDVGVYRCWIRNSEGAKYQDANLLVHYKPYWTKEIQDVSVPVQGGTFFNGTSDAKPIATCEWYKNGTRLKPSAHMKIEKCALTIINARLSDKGMYILMARNEHGSITTQSFVDVQAVKPKFETLLPDPMHLFRGRIGTIPCNPIGGPIPTKTWYVNNRIIDKSFTRFSQDVNGSLVINKVQDSDKGRYRCFVKNIKGSAEISTTVIVVEPTVITVPPAAPQGTTIKRGRDLTLVCDASYDKSLQLQIDWRKDGELIKMFDDRFSLERRVGDAAPRLLVIKKLKFEDRGNYTCNAYTILSTTADVKSLDSQTRYLSVSAPPETPLQLTVSSSCSNFMPTLTWVVGEANGDTMKFVIVEYTSEYVDDANTWYVAGKSEGESANQFVFGTGPRTMVLPGNAAIKFRVTAVNLVGSSTPSKPTLGSLCVTPAKAPSKNPTNLSIVATSSAKMDIVWDKMKIIDQNGPGFKYELMYRRVSSVNWIKRNFTNETTKFTVNAAGTFVQYEVCITTYNSKGACTAKPRARCIKDYSWQSKPTIAPSGFRASKIGFTDADLTWNPVSLPGGNIKGYRIYYWNTTAPFRPVITRGLKKKRRRRRSIETSVPTAEKPHMVEYLVGTELRMSQNISGLVPSLRYHAYVTAFNTGGEGPKSGVLVFETRATKSGFPDNIKMTAYGNVLHVQWESPLQPNGRTTGFVMRLVPKRDSMAKKSIDMIVVDKIDREYYIRGMTPCKFYEVWLGVMNQAGEGQFYRRRVAVSYPDIPGIPNLPRVVPYDANSVNITYKLPGYGGLPTSFKVYYKHKDAAYYDADSYYDAMYVEGANFLKQPWQTVKGLPELEYAFWTVGENRLGYSIPSDRVISQVMPYTTPMTTSPTTPNGTAISPTALNATERSNITAPGGPGARTAEGPWYTSRWFVGALSCVIFVLIVLIVILILINTHGGKYEVGNREKSHGGWNGAASSDFHRLDNGQTYAKEEPAIPMKEFTDSAPPPRYPSQQSIDKRPVSDDQESLDDYGENSRFREDGSFIGQYGEEKKRAAEEEDDDEEGASMFI